MKKPSLGYFLRGHRTTKLETRTLPPKSRLFLWQETLGTGVLCGCCFENRKKRREGGKERKEGRFINSANTRSSVRLTVRLQKEKMKKKKKMSARESLWKLALKCYICRFEFDIDSSMESIIKRIKKWILIMYFSLNNETWNKNTLI